MTVANAFFRRSVGSTESRSSPLVVSLRAGLLAQPSHQLVNKVASDGCHRRLLTQLMFEVWRDSRSQRRYQENPFRLKWNAREINMEFTSKTDEIPKGYGYVLKPSFLANALSAAGVEINALLVRSHSKRLFDAHFWPPNSYLSYERLYITAGTVIARDLPKFRQQVELEAIPILVRWISGIVSLDPKSPIRREKQTIQLLPPRDVSN